MSLHLSPLNSFSLADVDRLRAAEEIIKEKPGTFQRMMDRVLSGELRVWRLFGGKMDTLIVLGKEDGWLNIYFAVGKGVNMLEGAKMMIPHAASLGLKGLRAIATSPARARFFSRVPGTKQREEEGKIILELSLEDYANGRSRWRRGR